MTVAVSVVAATGSPGELPHPAASAAKSVASGSGRSACGTCRQQVEQSPNRDTRRLVKTKTPGIYKRLDADKKLTAYVVIYRAGGKQRKEFARTRVEARDIKSAR